MNDSQGNDVIEAARTGTFARSNQGIDSFSSVEIPPVTITLDLTGNLLTDFTEFAPNPHLQTLIVDNNPILSFHGFPEQSIEHFSAVDTPIADLPTFRQCALIAIGPHLKTINSVSVTASERLECSQQVLSEKIPERVVWPDVSSGKTDRHAQLQDCLRKGYICSGWPRRANAMQEAA
jgi:Leucine-rich repeat (LRR) protein